MWWDVSNQSEPSRSSNTTNARASERSWVIERCMIIESRCRACLTVDSTVIDGRPSRSTTTAISLGAIPRNPVPSAFTRASFAANRDAKYSALRSSGSVIASWYSRSWNRRRNTWALIRRVSIRSTATASTPIPRILSFVTALSHPTNLVPQPVSGDPVCGKKSLPVPVRM